MKKKLVSTITVTLLCICMVLTLASCAGTGGGGSASMEGKWALSAMKMGDQDYLALMAEMSKTLGEEFDPEGLMYCEFTADGGFKMVTTTDGQTEESAGTYKLNGNALTLTVDGEDQAATLSDNSFTITIADGGDEVSMTFTKK